MSTNEPETEEYRLAEEYDGVVRAGLVLQGDETAELTEGEAERHAEYIEPVNPPEEPETDETDNEEDSE